MHQNFRSLLKSGPIIITLLLSIALLTGCEKSQEPVRPVAAIEKVEIGLNNSKIGVIGGDFHFDANVLAGDKIETIEVKILPRIGQVYSKEWKLEIIWEQFRGAKNATVHKHFDIPSDAVEGVYDFLIIVNDQNGTKLEEKHDITILAPENLPVDLRFDFGIDVVDAEFKPIMTLYSLQAIFDEQLYKSPDAIKGKQFLAPIVSLAGIKGDGKMYCLIINKKHNHRPETIATVDFSKAVVADVWEHKGFSKSEFGSNMFNFSTNPLSIIQPSIEIGAVIDKNRPAESINGFKAWESGDYYVGFIYHNSTYNMGVFHYAEISLAIN